MCKCTVYFGIVEKENPRKIWDKLGFEPMTWAHDLPCAKQTLLPISYTGTQMADKQK